MKLRNLIFALFLAIGAIGFTACTGDDGATGPAGPAGPQGPPGEPGESESGEAAEDTDFYSFLESWGAEGGEAGCSDSLLTGMGPLPGPAAALPAITAADRGDDDSISGNVSAACTATIFGTVAADPEMPLLGTPAADSMVLIKIGKSAEPEETVSDEEATSFSQAKRTTTTKQFVEGLVVAALEDNGTGESLERELLYNDCGIGTGPPSIRGIWRAVEISESAQMYANSMATDDEATVTTTMKVCVQLDSHPGATKCYVEIDGPVADDTRAFVALYDGAELHQLGEDLSLDSPTAASLFATDDLEHGGNLCSLFGLE